MPQVAVATINDLLSQMPLELIELLCQELPLRDRVALTSCCRGLLERPDVAASTKLWAEVEAWGEALGHHLPPWLARRARGIHSLRLGPSQPLCSQLAAALAHLQDLRSLDLTRCGLASVPSQLSSLRCLDALSLDGNPGLGQAAAASGGSSSVFCVLGMLSMLTRLSMAECALARLPEELSALSSLARLNLANNHELGTKARGGDGLEPLRALSSLTHLSLFACRLEGGVPLELIGLPSLVDLDLVRAFDLEEGVEAAVAPLLQLAALTRVVLSRGTVPKRRLPPVLWALTAHGVLEWSY